MVKLRPCRGSALGLSVGPWRGAGGPSSERAVPVSLPLGQELETHCRRTLSRLISVYSLILPPLEFNLRVLITLLLALLRVCDCTVDCAFGAQTEKARCANRPP